VGPTFDAQRNELCAYVLREDQTPFGLTLGNFKTFASSTPKGGIRGLWDADSDQIIFGAHQIAYRVAGGATLFPPQIIREFTFLPYAQIAEFSIAPDVHVSETFYVPHGPAHDRVVAFVVDIALYNAAAAPVSVQIFPWALLIGQRFYGEPEKQVRASAGDRFIRSYGEESGAVRWWGGSRTPRAAVVALREQTLLQGMKEGALRPHEHLDEVTPQLAEYASSRIFGAFEYRLEIEPGGRESLRLAVVFHKDGDARSKPVLEQLLQDPDALPATQRYYAGKLADARLLTPAAAINRGVVWAKCNMLRVIKEYPQGWGSTNSPPSDILVSRDTSWFVHGYDYFLPEFSRAAIELFNRFLEPSGQVVEYVRGVGGFKTTYDLNVNDDTPLHIIAILHHFNATLDEEWLRGVFPTVTKIADYMLSQRDANGLLFCKASGVDMFGITSWRNIIPYYTLDGAVTEINAEAYFALEATARLAAIVDDTAAWQRYSNAASALRIAMLAELFNADTGAFVLNYDKEGHYQDDFTADEVFPVLFEVAERGDPAAVGRGRLHHAGRAAHDLDRRCLVLPLARLRLAGRRLARPHAVVRGRAGAQRRTRAGGALARDRLRDDGGRCAAQHGAGSVRRVVRRRLADEPWDVPLALDQRQVPVGRRRDRLWSRRLPHQRPPAPDPVAPAGVDLGRRGAGALGRPAPQLRDRRRARDRGRRHGLRRGRGAVSGLLRRPRRLGRGPDLAARSRRGSL